MRYYFDIILILFCRFFPLVYSSFNIFRLLSLLNDQWNRDSFHKAEQEKYSIKHNKKNIKKVEKKKEVVVCRVTCFSLSFNLLLA